MSRGNSISIAAMNVRQLLALEGKHALVTGGSRGLGLQIAHALGEMGAKIAITARKQNELDDAVAELVDAITRSSPLTVEIGKEAFYAQVDLDEHRAYDLTKSVMAMNALAGDAQEGMSAFLEKRAPSWTGS